MMNAVPATLSSRFPVACPATKVKIPITIISSDAVRDIGLTFTDIANDWSFRPVKQSPERGNLFIPNAISRKRGPKPRGKSELFRQGLGPDAAEISQVGLVGSVLGFTTLAEA
jgi:hypothetical protein